MARSDEALPVLTEQPTFDFVLIDGSHALPTVFLDFVYCNRALKRGGIIWIDDTQLYSGLQLALFIKAQPDWELVKRFWKTICFRKNNSKLIISEGNEPFQSMNSLC